MWESTRIGTNILPGKRSDGYFAEYGSGNPGDFQMESCGFSLKKKEMDMAELVRLQLADLNELFEQKNMELEIFLPEKCPCMADSGLMAIAVRNILVNAVRYSPAGERISVKLSTDYNVDSSTSNSFLLKEVSGCQNSRELKSMKIQRRYFWKWKTQVCT